jgi:hypothetical protein
MRIIIARQISFVLINNLSVFIFFLLLQLVVTKTSARGFPVRLGVERAGGRRQPSDDYWVDDLIRRLRASDRQV